MRRRDLDALRTAADLFPVGSAWAAPPKPTRNRL